MKYKAIDSQKVYEVVQKKDTLKLTIKQEKAFFGYYQKGTTQKEIEEITRILKDLEEV